MNPSEPFSSKQGEAYCEGVPLAKIAAEVGTPAYIYSAEALDRNCKSYLSSFASHPTLPCYAVKANANVQILRRIFSHGFGADVVSIEELDRAVAAGAKPEQIVFSGVAKQQGDIERGLNLGILSFNVESPDELEMIAHTASQMGRKARVSLRINPDIDPKTDPRITTSLYATKFGIPELEARELAHFCQKTPSLQLVGLSCHLGSQITELDVFEESSRRMAQFASELISKGVALELLDLGGGLAIPYRGEAPVSITSYADSLLGPVRKLGLKLVIEPGRRIVGNIGVLVTRVIRTKTTPSKKFVIVDAGMTELIRPALYEAFHRIEPVRTETSASEKVDIVGPICETTDVFASDRELPRVTKGELLSIRDCGAYGYVMASHYNGKPYPPEVLVEGTLFTVIRCRDRNW
jgi:diaminopimelate decarboxylase